MDDFTHIPEVDEYRNNPWGMTGSSRDEDGYGGYGAFTPKILADAAIVALEARVAALEAARAETFGQFQHMAKVALEQQRRAEMAEAELVVQRELRRTDNAAGAKLDQELRAEAERE